MRYFCTYFDHRYLPQGLAMCKSLKQYCSDFTVWVLCFDVRTYECLRTSDLPGVRPIGLEDFERGDELLQKAKTNRSLLEYYFTCTPSLPLFILRNYPEVNFISYLDADLFFFSNLDPLFEEMGCHSIAIIAHRFPPAFRGAERHGIFNVGWVSFRRDENGMSCLRRWREQCLDWCGDQNSDSRFADQKYLDEWPTRFKNLIALKHKGANLAPWNVVNYRIHLRGKDVFVDEDPLIFFHFHGLKQLNNYVYDTHLQHYGAKPSATVVRKIYAPYIRMITSLSEAFKDNSHSANVAPLPRESAIAPGRGSSFSSLRHLLMRRYLVVVNGRIL